MPIYKMEGKKNGLQKYRVRVNFTNAQGKADSVERVAYGYEDAKEKEAKLLKDIKEAPPAEKIKIKDFYKDYIEWKRPNVKETTLDKTEQHLRDHVLPFMGDDKLDFSEDRAFEWQAYINNKGLCVTTKNNILTSFKSMMNHAVKRKKINSNPLNAIGVFKDPNKIVKEMEIYSVDEFKKYITVAREQAEASGDTREWDYFVFFNIAFLAGLRKCEIHALKWSDISGDILKIRRGITQKLKGEDREGPPKTRKSNRDIRIPKQLKQVLDSHYARYKEADMFNDEWRVCGGLNPLRDSTIDKRNRKFAELAGVKRIRIHDFRHSHASYLIHKKVSVIEISKRLGHATVEETLNTYAHLYPTDEAFAVKVLNKIQI